MNHKTCVHDLIWLKPSTHLPINDLADWVSTVWDFQEPVIVRRDYLKNYIPVGIRGYARNQRQALWITNNDILQKISPQAVAALAHTPEQQKKLADFPAYQALNTVLQQSWPWDIGVTGSLAISLVSEKIYVNMSSDLDLTIRCEMPMEKSQFKAFYSFIKAQVVPIDVQIETPLGGFSLAEWMKSPTVMLKTDFGPKIINHPWREGI